MTQRPNLAAMSSSEKDGLITALLARLDALEAENKALVGENKALRDKLGQPPKTPDNSSRPPSQGHKANRPDGGAKKRKRRGTPGVARPLHPNPDRVVEARPEACPCCQQDIGAEHHRMQAVYDRIEIPPVRPDVTRVHQYAACCPGCGERVVAQPPSGLEPGSPFGRTVQALVIYLHALHAVSYERLAAMLHDLFGLDISEGAIANLLARTSKAFVAEAADIRQDLRRAEVICSDETSARVRGQTQWQWVFSSTAAVYHHIVPSRGKTVVEEVVGDHVPDVWVSDRYAAQRGHGRDWQVCLAHLQREVRYAREAGDTVLAPAIRNILRRALAIGRRRDTLQDSTLRQYRRQLERDLSRVLTRTPTCPAGEALRRKIVGVRAHLFVFITDRRVPPTNNVSERYLRPAVVFRKVTNCFRATWGARAYAAVRSVVDTGRLNDIQSLDAIRRVLAGDTVRQAATP
jgi:transposase